MSKHKKRRERRKKYHQMLAGELEQERVFVQRVIRSVDHGGMDIGPDGRPIKVDWWRFLEEQKSQNFHNGLAAQDLVERAVLSIQVRRH
jgi:hypothetical protein